MNIKNIFTATIMLISSNILTMDQPLSAVDRIFLNACKNNKSIDFALKQGANIFVIDPQNGFNALHYAYLHKNEERASFLIKNGVSLDFPAHNGIMPKDIPIIRNCLMELCKENISFKDFCLKIEFLKNNYKDNYKDILNFPLDLYGSSLLHHIITNEKPVAWIQFLLDNGVDINYVSQQGTPLYVLLCSKTIINNQARSHIHLRELVELLISRGADLSIPGMFGHTILQAAIQFQPDWIRPILTEMINKGQDISKADQMNHNALFEVITTYTRKDVLKILKLLFDSGCKPLIDTAGISLMHKAVERSYQGLGNAIPIIEELLKRGVGVNDIDNNGQTPLHYAAESASSEVVNMLLYAGAMHPRMPDKTGNNPLDFAKNNKDKKKVIDLLLKAEAAWLRAAEKQRAVSIAEQLKKESLSKEILAEYEEQKEKNEKNIKSTQQNQKKEKVVQLKKSKKKNNKKNKTIIVAVDSKDDQQQKIMIEEKKDAEQELIIEEKKIEKIAISEVPKKQKKSLLVQAQDLAVKVLTGKNTDVVVKKTYAAALELSDVQQPKVLEKKEEFEDDYVTIATSIKSSLLPTLTNKNIFNPLASIDFYSENVLLKMANETDFHHNFSSLVENRLGPYFTCMSIGDNRKQFTLAATLTYPSGKSVDGRFNYVIKQLHDGKTELRHRHFEKEKKNKKIPLLLSSSSDQWDKGLQR